MRRITAICSWQFAGVHLQLLLGLAMWLAPLAAYSAPTLPAASELDDTITPIAEPKPRSESAQDHLDALAHFAAGRMAQQREDNADALREYQRAARLDPNATLVLREISQLAFALERPGVAVRYALLAVEKEPNDPVFMRRLAAFLTDDGDQEKALQLYEKAAEAEAAKPVKPNASTVFTAMEMGRLYFLAKKYDKAADRFAEVMKALDKPADFSLDEPMRKAILGSGEVTYQLFAEAFIDAERFDDAIAAYLKADSYKPDAPALAIRIARVEFNRKNYDAALEKLQEYLAAKRSDQGVLAYRLLSDILTAQGNAKDLLRQLEKLRETDEQNVPIRFFLAEEYRKAGEFDRSQQLYEDLKKLTQDRLPVEAQQGLVAIYESRGDVEPLLRVLGDVVQRTGSLDVLDDAGKKLITNAELMAKLIDFANGKVAADPTALSFGERLAVAELALATKKVDEADKWFELAMLVRPEKSAEPMLAWGLQLFLADRYASASKVFRRVIDEGLLPKDNPAAHYYLAGALEMEGKTDEAVAVAREGAALRPDAARFASRPGWILYHAKRYEDARAAYQKLLEEYDGKHDSNETRDVMRDARLVLSNIAVQQGKMAEAEDWLEQVLDEFPEDVGAQNDLGFLYADQDKRHERALRMTQKAVDAEPKNAAYRDSLGWAFYRLGRYTEAVKELQQALALEEHPNGVLYDHLGDALAKAGDVIAAHDAYSKAIEAFTKANEPEKAEQVKKKLPNSGGP